MRKKVEHEGNTWFQIKCDNCNKVLENHDGLNLMPDELSIENMAMEHDWTRGQNETHICTDCPDEYLEQE